MERLLDCAVIGQRPLIIIIVIFFAVGKKIKLKNLNLNAGTTLALTKLNKIKKLCHVTVVLRCLFPFYSSPKTVHIQSPLRFSSALHINFVKERRSC